MDEKHAERVEFRLTLKRRPGEEEQGVSFVRIFLDLQCKSLSIYKTRPAIGARAEATEHPSEQFIFEVDILGEHANALFTS